jgi:hypothetical protein
MSGGFRSPSISADSKIRRRSEGATPWLRIRDPSVHDPDSGHIVILVPIGRGTGRTAAILRFPLSGTAREQIPEKKQRAPANRSSGVQVQQGGSNQSLIVAPVW